MCAQIAVPSEGAALVGRARAGDREAFAELVSLHGPDVLRLCMVITTDRALAEDAAQNAWHKAWRKLHTLRDGDRLRPWLLSVAANESRQLLRKSRRELTVEVELAADDRVTPTDALLDLKKALRRLRSEDRELLAHRYAMGMTSTEIAEQLRMSPEGIRSRLKRLRDELREELER
jgi:RNA polymerase sigma-70 factor (ECF subfamily)